jgi:acyl-CoA synthetase (AMP-forming)/AMP-acid ligase II
MRLAPSNDAQPSSNVDPDWTLARLHLAAERRHDRAALLQGWDGARVWTMPDWRFHRQVLRIALYLQEAAGVHAGDRVALLAPLGTPWLVAEWAAFLLGAASVAINPWWPSSLVAGTLAEVAPRVVLFGRSTETATVQSSETSESIDEYVDALGAMTSLEEIVVLDPTIAARLLRARVWSEVLDLGGTLDTAERAQRLREQARAIGADAPAMIQIERGSETDGGTTSTSLTHRDVLRRLRRAPPRAERGDVAYVACAAPTLPMRLALSAFVTDGYTRTVLGTHGREAEQIAEVHPHKIVAPREVVERALAPDAIDASLSHAHGLAVRARIATWLGRAPIIGPMARRLRAREDARAALGGRVRWWSPVSNSDRAAWS